MAAKKKKVVVKKPPAKKPGVKAVFKRAEAQIVAEVKKRGGKFKVIIERVGGIKVFRATSMEDSERYYVFGNETRLNEAIPRANQQREF